MNEAREFEDAVRDTLTRAVRTVESAAHPPATAVLALARAHDTDTWDRPLLDDVRVASRLRWTTRAAPVWAAVIVVVIAVLVVISRNVFDHAQPAAPGSSAPAWPVTNPFGPASLPGYTETDLSIFPAYSAGGVQPGGGQWINYSNRAGAAVDIFVVTSTPSLTSMFTTAHPVRVGSQNGYYGTYTTVAGMPYLNRGPVVAWRITPTQWAVVNGYPPSAVHPLRSTPPAATSFTEAELISVASMLDRTHQQAAILPIKIGYIPHQLRMTALSYSTHYALPSGQYAPTDRLLFTDRSVTLSAGYVLASTLEVRLSTLSAETAPSGIDPGPGGWKQTTIDDHPAWIAATGVYFYRGNTQIALLNPSTLIIPRGTGPFDTVPNIHLSQAELIKIASSITIPAHPNLAAGYTFNAAIPHPATR